MIDLLVVILGISIAFGIDNWAEARRNERTKQQYLINLSNDLRADSVALKETQQDLQKLDSVITVVQSLTSRENLSDADSIARAMSIFGRYGFFTPEDYTYKSLQQSGDFGLLANDSIQIVLSKLYNNYEALELQQDLFKTIMFDYIIPYYFNYDMRKGTVVNPEIYFEPRLTVAVGALQGNTSQRKSYVKRASQYLTALRRLINEELK